MGRGYGGYGGYERTSCHTGNDRSMQRNDGGGLDKMNIYTRDCYTNKKNSKCESRAGYVHGGGCGGLVSEEMTVAR